MTDPNDARSRSGYRPIPEQPRPRPHPQQPYPQAPYAQQPYPQAPYAQQPYPQVYPPQPYAPAPYPPSPGRGRRLSLVWAGVGLVAAVGIGLGAGALAVPSEQKAQAIGDLRIGAAPGSIDSYHRMTGAFGHRVAQRIRGAMTAANSTSAQLYGNALVAVYALRGSPGPDLLVVANDADNASVVRLLQAGDSTDRVREFVVGLGATGVQDYPSAPLGGSMQCGTQTGLNATVCVWFDDSTFGYVVDYAGNAPKQVAGVTVRMRTATEH